MTAQTDTTKLDVQTVSLQIKESAELELVKAKGILKQNASDAAPSMGWLAHLSKILEVFEAIDKSNSMMNKLDTSLEKADYLKQILYNAINNCQTLDQLKYFFDNFAKNTGAFAQQDPSLANLMAQMGGIIQGDETSFMINAHVNSQSAVYQNWCEEKLPLFTNLFHEFDLDGSTETKAGTTFEKNTESERSTLISAMNTLGTMNVQSLDDPSSASDIENRDA